MKSSDDVQILSLASLARRGRMRGLNQAETFQSRYEAGLRSPGNYSGYQSNSRKESVPGINGHTVSDFRNCQQLTK